LHSTSKEVCPGINDGTNAAQVNTDARMGAVATARMNAALMRSRVAAGLNVTRSTRYGAV